MVEELAEGRTPLLLTYPSPAVRLCRAAVEAGLDLTGVQLRLYGEPVTAARLDAIRQSGAQARAIYAATESWRIGEPCLHPDAPDEVHLGDDVNALVQPGVREGHPGLPPRTLLLTSLRPSAPVVLLNASLGDEAIVSVRRCGCPLERLGWAVHLSHTRSHEKLTAGGMTFLDADVVRVLDETLPTRFGGGPTDYQLIEGEADDGQARIRLLVHPRVGPLNPDAVSRAFLDALGRGAGAAPVMTRVWDNSGVVTVERRPPMATGTGKIHHVHQLAPGPRQPDP
jgi:hypothetical protein